MRNDSHGFLLPISLATDPSSNDSEQYFPIAARDFEESLTLHLRQ